jgi:cell division inhibitor SepF
MAKFFDKILDSMKLNDEDDEYDEEFDGEAEEDEPREKKSFRSSRKAKAEEEDVDDYEEKPSPFRSKRQPNNVVPMRNRSMEVCMFRPKSVEEGREICDTLLSGRAVVINLEGINMDVAQRIIDFTSGACYSMNGNLQKISNYIFIVTPQSVELSGDFQEMLGGNLDVSSFNIQI